MLFRYDEDFIEAAIFVCASGRRKGVPSLQVARFHREREKLYAILDAEARDDAFFNLHLGWFREWGLEDVLTAPLRDFPLLSQGLSVLAVRQNRGKDDAGAELYVNVAGQRTAVLALKPDRFVGDDSMRDYLRHEFMHLHDMMDEAFAYQPKLDLPGLNPAQHRLARERYRLLWDIVVDARLEARGWCPQEGRAEHMAAFDGAYPFWTQERRILEFGSLWRMAHPTHAALLSLILDPRGLGGTQTPAPGASCPLCDFPTFSWADPNDIAPELARRVRSEFPDWDTKHGLCSRCLESYEAAAANA